MAEHLQSAITHNIRLRRPPLAAPERWFDGCKAKMAVAAVGAAAWVVVLMQINAPGVFS